MKIIGILGDIGSGKSFVAKKLGYPVFNADLEINKIYKKNLKCFKKLNKSFPRYIKSFPISKTELSNLILASRKNLKKIGHIVHPYVQKNLKNFLFKNKNKKIVTLDIPLLLENNIEKNEVIENEKEEDFDFNQDNSIELGDEYRSPGWDRLKKRLIKWKK